MRHWLRIGNAHALAERDEHPRVIRISPSGDLRLTQHLMGHSGPNTTAIYTHVTPRKEREKLAEYLK